LKEEVFISLGSNKGDRIKALSAAVQAIGSFAEITARSPVYETPPWGFDSDQPFLNAVIGIFTELSPQELLESLLQIEKDSGRYRSKESQGYQDRSLDLDILFYGNRIINQDSLQVPHPRMERRKFILVPLNDIAGEFEHPALKNRVKELLKNVKDQAQIKRTNYEL
jgi:2-amino-4-hydroxy-6-hydroxymethyldihydropteridine diphosphokinase